MFKSTRTLATYSVVSLVIATALSGSRFLMDVGDSPVGMVPSAQTVLSGQQVAFQVTMSKTSSTDIILGVSSNSGLLTVPTSVTVPAGSLNGYFMGTANSGSETQVKVTATGQNGQSSTTITVD